MDKNYKYEVSEIAEKLCNMTKKYNVPSTENIITDVTNALYELEAMTQNEYNKNYWRTFYQVLQDIIDYE